MLAFSRIFLNSEYDQEMPESHTVDQPSTPWGGDTAPLQTSSFCPSEMIVKQERTPYAVQLNTDHQTRNPRKGGGGLT